jgi:hypothetical protein
MAKEHPFPPEAHRVSESAENTARWRSHLSTVKLHDPRKSRHPARTVIADNLSWRRVVRADEIIIVRVSGTNEIVLLVLRNFCRDTDVLHWVDSAVVTAVDTKMSVRLDDHGALALVGWPSGTRDRKCLMWAIDKLHLPSYECLVRALPPEQRRHVCIWVLDDQQTPLFAQCLKDIAIADGDLENSSFLLPIACFLGYVGVLFQLYYSILTLFTVQIMSRKDPLVFGRKEGNGGRLEVLTGFAHNHRLGHTTVISLCTCLQHSTIPLSRQKCQSPPRDLLQQLLTGPPV